MRKTIAVSMMAGMVFLASGQVRAAETPAKESLTDSLKKACNKELTTFCNGVVPGEGRVLACLYAFEDQVTDQCVYALYDAAAKLEQAVVALQYAATQCKDDFKKFCADVPLGQGRGLACIEKNEKDVSQACKDALAQTGLKTKAAKKK